jgi:hypothetical protein
MAVVAELVALQVVLVVVHLLAEQDLQELLVKEMRVVMVVHLMAQAVVAVELLLLVLMEQLELAVLAVLAVQAQLHLYQVQA